MKPVDQTRFYDKDKSLRGNCMQAAVASILELPLDAVPNFIEEEAGFWPSFTTFLRSRGFIYLDLHEHPSGPDCFYLASGDSPRAIKHTVIYRNGRLVHDPHPSRAGLLTLDMITLLIPINPAQVTP